MAKLTLITAMHWIDIKLDECEIPASQQLCLFHIVRRLNRNCWRPVQISVNSLALMMSSAKRTAKTALDELIKRGWLVNTKNGITLNLDDTPKTEDVTYNESKGEVNGEIQPPGCFESLAEKLARIHTS